MTVHRPQHGFELFREDDEYVVSVELDGFEREDVSLSWHDGRLSISAEHVGEAGRSGVYHRSVGFHRTVDPEGISASLEEGVLEVRLPIVDAESPHGVEIDIEG